MRHILIQPLVVLLGLALAFLLTGCVHGRPDQESRAAAVRALRNDLTALALTVQPEEAQRAAACAYDASQQLAREYRVIRPAGFHNFLVNLGLKQRGLCHHWAEDLTEQLDALDLATLKLHWGVARHQTLREHNCVVITARDQPFQEGLVLDAWRRSGRLVWIHVGEDHYPWVEAWRLPPP